MTKSRLSVTENSEEIFSRNFGGSIGIGIILYCVVLCCVVFRCVALRACVCVCVFLLACVHLLTFPKMQSGKISN